MIIRNQFITEDGRELVETSSDRGNFIIRNDGVRFDKAIDPTDSGRIYYETDEPIPSGEITEVDKDAALRRFGVEV